MNTKYLTKRDPITSYGVINLYLCNELHQYAHAIKNTYSNKNVTDISFIENNMKDNEYITIKKMVENNLLFLLVSRNHSLGYIEFIRGRYDISDSNTIIHLFHQMTDTEIFNIFTMPFDNLWCELWKKNARKNIYNKEYTDTSEKFNLVRLLYNIDSFKPEFPIQEWGFPRGRKNNNENNIQCASRECCEETSLITSELNILTSILPLLEEMKGTNDISYRHIYYLSIIDNIRPLTVINEESQYVEIDTIGWFKRDLVSNLFRPYHVEKINIIDKVITFIAHTIYCAKK